MARSYRKNKLPKKITGQTHNNKNRRKHNHRHSRRKSYPSRRKSYPFIRKSKFRRNTRKAFGPPALAAPAPAPAPASAPANHYVNDYHKAIVDRNYNRFFQLLKHELTSYQDELKSRSYFSTPKVHFLELINGESILRYAVNERKNVRKTIGRKRSKFRHINVPMSEHDKEIEALDNIIFLMIKVILHQPSIVPEPQEEVLRTRGGRPQFSFHSEEEENVSLDELVKDALIISVSIETENKSKYKKYNKQYPGMISPEVSKDYNTIASYFINHNHGHFPPVHVAPQPPNLSDNGISDI